MKHIRIASRASKLALIQSEQVSQLIRQIRPDIEFSIVKVSTRGDRDKADFIHPVRKKAPSSELSNGVHKSGSIGFFTTEVEKALLDGKADLAVHSYKDLPTALTKGLVIAAVPKRESPADALVASQKLVSIEDLSAGATIGTSSLRRIAQLRRLRGDIKCVPMRGNVETRVRKINQGEVSAIVVACAGLNRLGLADKISFCFDPKKFTPAPAQGALAVQVRSDDKELAELVSQIDDKNSRIAVETERLVLQAMHGGCSIPLGVYAEIQTETINIDAIICDVEGKNCVKRSIEAPVEDAKSAAEKLAKELLSSGGQKILKLLNRKI
jgi:hydroxymethylbilane synthase